MGTQQSYISSQELQKEVLQNLDPGKKGILDSYQLLSSELLRYISTLKTENIVATPAAKAALLSDTSCKKFLQLCCSVNVLLVYPILLVPVLILPFVYRS